MKQYVQGIHTAWMHNVYALWDTHFDIRIAGQCPGGLEPGSCITATSQAGTEVGSLSSCSQCQSHQRTVRRTASIKDQRCPQRRLQRMDLRPQSPGPSATRCHCSCRATHAEVLQSECIATFWSKGPPRLCLQPISKYQLEAFEGWNQVGICSMFCWSMQMALLWFNFILHTIPIEYPWGVLDVNICQQTNLLSDYLLGKSRLCSRPWNNGQYERPFLRVG